MSRSSVVLAAALCLAACGGGGGDGSASTSTGAGTTPTNPTTPTLPTAPAGPTSAGSTCGIGNFQASALALINQQRAAGAVCGTQTFAATTPLVWNAQLTQAAEGHTQDMVSSNLFSHTGSDGSTLATRVDATGYAWNVLGENIAAGQVGLSNVMTAWVNSPDHCANLMDPRFVDVGLVCVPGTASTTYGTYWTMDLGRSP